MQVHVGFSVLTFLTTSKLLKTSIVFACSILPLFPVVRQRDRWQFPLDDTRRALAVEWRRFALLIARRDP